MTINLRVLFLSVVGLACCLARHTHGAANPQEPPIRTGLWVMQKLPENAPALKEFAAKVSGNRFLNGVCLNFAWKSIENESAKPDFSKLDQAVEVLRKLHLKYQLCLKPGTNTPAFVYKDGAQPFVTQVTNPHRANVGESVEIPVPWDPVYERDLSRIIAKLGDRYAGDPLCVSVVLTCANFLSAEMHLPKTRSDLEKWTALGNYEVNLLGVYKRFTDVWASAFPHQEISLHLSKVLDLPPGFCEQIIEYGLSKYPQRFTIQSCQLSGRKEDTGVMTYNLVQKYRDRAHHGFQSLAALSRPNPRMGSIEMAALNLVHAQGEYWELWNGDGLSVATSEAVSQAWEEAKRLGYEAYKRKLISEGRYRY